MDLILNDLKNGEAIRKIFETWSEDGKLKCSSDGFKYLISELSVSYNLDLTEFSINTETDNVISWDDFKELLLTYFNGFSGHAIEQVIEKTVKKVIKIIGLEEINNAISSAFIYEKPEPKLKKRPDSWITPYIKEYKKEIIAILASMDEEKKKVIKGSNLQTLLKRLLQLFNITLDEKDLFLFDRMVENRYKQSKSGGNASRYKYLQLTYSQCIGLIEEWALKESYKQINVKDQIPSLISEYEDVLIKIKNMPEIAENIQNLLSQLKGVQSKTTFKPIQDLVDLQKKGLKDIFDFYAKQLKMVGKSPTFSQLTVHKDILNLSKFTKFCSDFDLINSIRDKHKINLKQISNIFIKATECQRAMNFNQFLLSIDLLAEAYYSEQYDIYYRENLFSLGIEEKKKRLLLLIHCDDPTIYSQKLKGFGQPFNAEKKEVRIPDYDLSKRYKYKDQTKVKQQISVWKEQKIKIESPNRSKSVPSHARLKAIQQSLLMRPDRVTWDLLNKNANFISKEDLAKILDVEDIKELIRDGVKIV